MKSLFGPARSEIHIRFNEWDGVRLAKNAFAGNIGYPVQLNYSVGKSSTTSMTYRLVDAEVDDDGLGYVLTIESMDE